MVLLGLWKYPKKVQYFECKKDLRNCRFSASLYQFIHLVLKAYDFPKGLIEWQVVQMILEKDHQSLEKAPISIEDEVVISFWDNPEEVTFLSI